MPVTFNGNEKTPESLREFYRSGDFAWNESENALRDPVYAEKNRIIESSLREIAPARLLDVGCGGGAVLRGAGAAFAVGIDLNEAALRAAGDGISGAAGDAEKLPFKSGVFDCVVCSETLEHLPDPAAALAEIARALESGGRLIVTVPNLFCWDSIEGETRIIERSLGAVNGALSFFGAAPAFPDGWNTHLWKMPPRRWKKLIEEAGFSVREDGPIYVFPYIPYFLGPLKRAEAALWRLGLGGRGRRGSFTRLPVGQLHFFLCEKTV